MSKGLEALKFISRFTNFQDGYYKDKLDSIEKELKALEIIKALGLDIGWFQRNLNEGMTYEDYAFSNPRGKYYLTEQNFNILKETLKNEQKI